nr:hypothetical protein [Tanacetum cinerariifolium]
MQQKVKRLQDQLRVLKKLHASTPSHSVPQPREFNVVKHRNVIAPGMFKINPSKTPRENVSSNTVTTSSIGLVHTARTRRPQPKDNTRNAKVLSASKSSEVKKNVTVKDHCWTLLLSKNQKTMSFECNNIKLAIRNDKSVIVCDTCKQCLVTANHDACVPSSVNALNSRANKLNIKLLINFVWKFLGTVCFGNDHIAAILGYGGTLASLEIWMVLTCSKAIVLQISTPSISMTWPWLHLFVSWPVMISSPVYQSLNMPKNIFVPLVSKEKSKRASHPPKPVLTSKQRLYLLHMDLCGPMRVASTIGKRYVLIYVRLQAPVIIVRTDNGTEFKNHVLKEYFDSVGITHETSAAKTPQQNGFVERRNRTLVEAARTMLIFSHAPLFLWAEAIATVCHTQNRSIIHRRFNKAPYELIQGRKPDIFYLYVFGALCYPKNDREDISKLGAKGDIGFFIGYSANSVAYRFKTQSTSGQISSELDLTYAPSTITPQRPSKWDLDILFEPLHNEYLGGRPSAVPRTIHVAPVVQNLQAPTASMSCQDSAPVPTNSSNTLVSSHSVDVTSQQHAQQQRNLTPSPTASTADNVPNAVFEGDLFVNPFGTPSTESVVSSTQYLDPSNMHTFYQPYPHDYQWTNDHPLEQVIGEPSRPVLTRNQLKTDGDMCIYALTINIVEPKIVKESLTDLAWIESMQEKLHQYIRLNVWELVPSPNGIKPLTLKWLIKNKHDEENTVIHNKDSSCCFINVDHPSHVYKLKKAWYAFKQASSAWYDELSTFLLQNGFSKGTIDPTLFTRCFDDDILVVNQSPSDKLDLDQIGTPVDATKYRIMIGALMYLTLSRPNIVHATCDSGFELTGFSDADYAGCKDTFKSTSGGAQFLGEKLVFVLSSSQTRRDLPKDTPIDRLEVLRYDTGKRSKMRTGIMPTQTELTLEQTQQEHQSDIFVIFTLAMEILLEPTSNKLLVGNVRDFIWIELVTLDINLGP